MDLPQRKRIRLTDFDYNTPTAYFITLCTQDRKPLLSEIVGDDAHIRPQHNRVASIVRLIKTLTTKEIGVPIFQRFYYHHVIRNQRDYDEVWEYIEGNPSKLLNGKMDDI